MSTILIACERESEEQVLSQALSERGYQVLKSRDGIEALELARTATPRLVLANVSLPKMDGFALFRKCKQDEKLQLLPFIFYTSRRSDPKYERFALELGAKGFIHGTSKPELVLDAVEAVLAAIDEQPQPPIPVVVETLKLPALSDELQVSRQQLAERLSELESLHDRLTDSVQFSNLFELNPLAMWIVDKANHTILAANDAALALYGYTRAEFMAITADQLVSGESTAFGATHIIAHRHKDGRALSLFTMSKDVEFKGKAAELMAAHDMTYRVRAERKIVEDAQRLRVLLAALPDGYWVLDKDNRLLEVNERYCQMSGYGREELLKLSSTDLQVSAESPVSDSAIPGLVRAAHRRKDGAEWLVEISSTELDATTGRRLELIRPTAPRVEAPPAPPVPPARLPRLVELLHGVDGNDELDFLRSVATRLEQVFDDRVAIIAEVDRNALTFRLLAASSSHIATSPTRTFPLPAEWQSALQSDAVRAIEAEPGALAIPGLADKRQCLVSSFSGGEAGAWLFALLGNAGYSDEERSDFHAFTQVLAQAMARKRASTKVLGDLQRADVAMENMIDLLCRLVDQHDPHTAGSSPRVAALAVAIARTLGLGGEQQRTVYLAARLHDIGNVMIPREILARPLKLGEHEIALVRTHAELGASLLAEVHLGNGVAEAVRQHHERLDGSGYPRRLKQAEILVEARILAVADVVEAMCSSRPYREASGLPAALAEIAAGSGTLYDPDVVTICTNLFGVSGFQWPS